MDLVKWSSHLRNWAQITRLLFATNLKDKQSNNFWHISLWIVAYEETNIYAQIARMFNQPQNDRYHLKPNNLRSWIVLVRLSSIFIKILLILERTPRPIPVDSNLRSYIKTTRRSISYPAAHLIVNCWVRVTTVILLSSIINVQTFFLTLFWN